MIDKSIYKLRRQIYNASASTRLWLTSDKTLVLSLELPSYSDDALVRIKVLPHETQRFTATKPCRQHQSKENL